MGAGGLHTLSDDRPAAGNIQRVASALEPPPIHIDQGIARLVGLLVADRAELTTGRDPLQSLCRQLLHSMPATDAGADDRTLLLAELTPAKSSAPL